MIDIREVIAKIEEYFGKEHAILFQNGFNYDEPGHLEVLYPGSVEEAHLALEKYDEWTYSIKQYPILIAYRLI